MTQIRLTNDMRRYVINGSEYPRVTDICSIIRRPGLEKWKIEKGMEESTRIAKETAEYGDLVHEVTMWNDLNRMDKVDEMLKTYDYLVPPWVAWFDWAGEYIKKILYVELIVWSNKWRCAGKIDLVAIMKGDRSPSILDKKTGSLYDEIGIQLHAYKLLYNENHNPVVKRTLAIQLPRIDPGSIHVKEYDKPKHTEAFKSAVKLYYATK